MQSTDGTIILAGSSDTIVDGAGTVWGIAGGKVTVNSIADTTTSDVVALAYLDGLIWRETSDLLWSVKSTASDPWSAPSAAAASSVPIVIAGVDGNGNSAALPGGAGVTWAVVGGQIAMDGTIDPTTANVREIAIVNGAIWQENTAGLWWSKSAASDAWDSPDGPDGTPVNPLNGSFYQIEEPPSGAIADPVEIGDIAGTGTPAAQGSADINPPRFVGSIVAGGLQLFNATFGISELSSGSGPLVLEGDSFLLDGSHFGFGLLGTGGLPPGNLQNNGTMILASSTLSVGALVGDGVISVVGNGSLIGAGTIGAGETVDLHAANLELSRPRLSYPTLFQASIQFDPQSSVLDAVAASGQMFVGSGDGGGELFLYDNGSLRADFHVSGVGQVYASAAPQGETLLTPYDTGQSLPTLGFAVHDGATQASNFSIGAAYSGPVTGLQRQFVDITADTLNIASSVPNSFIAVGSGLNSIDVSAAGGNNILDGGTGSAFMTGGSGNDTFYVDDRGAAASIFSTIVGFHWGDTVDVWGIDAANSVMHVLDNEGVPGAQGLDLVFSSPGHADASFVLAGYTSADLSNGRLSVSYGRTADMPGLPGSSFVMVQQLTG